MDDLKKLLKRKDIAKDVKSIIQKSISEQEKQLESWKNAQTDFLNFWEFNASILDQSPIGIFSINTEYIVTSWNKHLEQLTGIKEKEILGKNLFDNVPSVIETGWEKEYKKVLKTGKPFILDDYEYTPTLGPYKDQLLHSSSKIVPLISDGEVNGVIMILEDITKRKQAEKSLKLFEEKYRSIIDNIPAVTWITDEKGKTTFMSPNIERIFGFTPEEIYKANEEIWFGRIHKNDVEIVKKEFRSFIKKKTHFDVEYRIQRKDDKWIWLHDSALRSYEEDGTIYGYGILTDITERKKTEDALRTSESRFRRLFEDAPFPLMELNLSEIKEYLIDQKKLNNPREVIAYFSENLETHLQIFNKIKFVDANESLLNLYELENKQELHTLLMPAEGFPFLKEAFPKILFGQESFEMELTAITSKGKEIHGLGRLSVVPDYKDTLSKVFFTLIDITLLKEAEKTLRENELKLHEMIETLRDSEEKVRGIIENSKDGVVLIDEKGLIIEWNNAIENLLEIDEENAMGRSFWDVYTPLIPKHVLASESAKSLITRFDELSMTGKADWLSRPLETEVALNLGHKFVQIDIFSIKTKKGFRIGTIWRDVTKQKELEVKMKEELLKFKIEDQNIYLIKEADPLFSREIFRDMSRIGYSGWILSRTPEIEYREVFDGSFKFLWLAEANLGEEYSSLFQKIISLFERLPPKNIVLIERLDFLISKYGFNETLLFIYKIREIAIFLNLVILLSVDDEIVPENQIKTIEKETKIVQPKVLAKLPLHLLEILRFVYKRNNIGTQPSYTHIAYELGISRPTARKRIKELTAIGYLKENQKGRTKVLELSLRGLNSFTD